MAIKKRKIKVRKPKPKLHPRVVRHRKACDDLYNRLQQDDDDSVRYVMDQLMGMRMSAHLCVQHLMARATTEVKTLQINGGSGQGATYSCFMSYEDRTKKPKHGWLYPTKYCVKSSPVLIRSVMLCYVELCKHVGRFV